MPCAGGNSRGPESHAGASISAHATLPALPALLLLTLLASPALAQDTLPAELRAKIDTAVTEVLAKTGAPSASIAVVRDGTPAYVHAYGTANLGAKTPATPQMRYSLGSISKQFAAAAVLLLAEEHKLSLDDRLVRFLPELTRAQDIVARWGRITLDFEPGSRWQYSNTHYVIAGLVVERVAGTPLLDFLQQRVFGPLGMASVVNVDAAGLGPEDPARYMRYALGPLRPAPKEGKGWLFAAGELAMTAADLAKWDVSMIDETVLKPASYRTLGKLEQFIVGAQ